MSHAPHVARPFERARANAGATIVRKRPKRTAATIYTVSQLLERHRDPRDVLLEIASMTIEAIVKATKCAPMEALQEKRLCAMAVLPYVASKMPVQVDMRHHKAIHLNIVDGETYQELQATAAAGDQALLIGATVIDAANVTETDIVQEQQQHSSAEGDGTGVAHSTSPSPTDDASER